MTTASLVTVFLCLGVVTACGRGGGAGDAAQLDSSSKGLPKAWVEVNSELYRSARPTKAQISTIADQGIKTVLAVEDFSGNQKAADSEESEVEDAGMSWQQVPMSGSEKPTVDEIDQALAIINDASAQPVLVHCHYGEDRTGIVVAAYRMTHDHWSEDKAVQEMRDLGHNSSLYWWDDVLDHYAGQ